MQTPAIRRGEFVARFLPGAAVSTGAWTLLGLISAVALFLAFMTGRDREQEIVAAEELAIASENRSFCTDLGLSESEVSTRCVKGLTDIRERARERLEEQSASLL
jgi:hypothetical protein